MLQFFLCWLLLPHHISKSVSYAAHVGGIIFNLQCWKRKSHLAAAKSVSVRSVFLRNQCREVLSSPRLQGVHMGRWHYSIEIELRSRALGFAHF